MALAPDPRDISDKAAREATEWFVRLGNPAITDEDRRAYERWLAADRAHADAMEEVRGLWDRLEEPAALLAAEQEIRISGAGTQARSFWRPIAIAATIVLAAAAALVWRDQGLIDRMFADYATAPGERRELLLADGSHIYLDGDTALVQSFTASSRAITMLRGRAWFDVSPDPSRPFLVHADPLETRVLGTAFGVDRDSGSVTVEHGSVAVSAGQGEEARLTGSERVSLVGGRLSAPEKIELDVALGWRRGLIILDSAPLGVVIDELSHMAPGRIIVSDAELRKLTLSGVFQADDPDAVIEAMRTALGLKTLSVPGFATLVYR
ncbi:sensor [Agaricicola taiwanensis]|uniref:Sensor n=1 Tax=Agaricicola taiwanensis TaxID=591372 RepID=A0A8J2YJN2_9RHOB|nr:FecR domain-containing protein [Agaricicola taiwanensis]GGE48654.1 sensor [Agaricicola taiwanensis]